MKKIMLYILILMVVTFCIPIVFTKQMKQVSVEQTEQPQEPATKIENNYDYKNYTMVKLLHTKTNQIEEVKLDEYLYHVVSAEMPADFELEALKAQAVVARTYTIYKIMNNQKKHGEADICDSASCCQAWITKEDRLARWEEGLRESNWSKIMQVVDATQGKLITYNGEPINAFFHSNSGGTTEMPINVWGGSGYPYLQVVQTAGEEEYGQYQSEATFTQAELVKKIKETHPELSVDFVQEDSIKVTEHTDSGRVRTLKVGNVNLSGVEARTILGLRSTNFRVEKVENSIKFSVIRIWTWSRYESNRCRCLSKTREKL